MVLREEAWCELGKYPQKCLFSLRLIVLYLPPWIPCELDSHLQFRAHRSDPPKWFLLRLCLSVQENKGNKQPIDNLKKKKKSTTKSFHAKTQLSGFILKLSRSGLVCWWHLSGNCPLQTKDMVSCLPQPLLSCSAHSPLFLSTFLA